MDNFGSTDTQKWTTFTKEVLRMTNHYHAITALESEVSVIVKEIDDLKKKIVTTKSRKKQKRYGSQIQELTERKNVLESNIELKKHNLNELKSESIEKMKNFTPPSEGVVVNGFHAISALFLYKKWGVSGGWEDKRIMAYYEERSGKGRKQVYDAFARNHGLSVRHYLSNSDPWNEICDGVYQYLLKNISSANEEKERKRLEEVGTLKSDIIKKMKEFVPPQEGVSVRQLEDVLAISLYQEWTNKPLQGWFEGKIKEGKRKKLLIAAAAYSLQILQRVVA